MKSRSNDFEQQDPLRNKEEELVPQIPEGIETVELVGLFIIGDLRYFRFKTHENDLHSMAAGFFADDFPVTSI